MPELYNPLSLKDLKRKVKKKGGESPAVPEVKSQQPLLSCVSCEILLVVDLKERAVAIPISRRKWILACISQDYKRNSTDSYIYLY